MLKEINERLHILKEEVALKKVLEEKREKLRGDLRWEENVLEQLRITLEKEHKDVEKLEKVSLSNFIATLMQNKIDKLEKEQQEYLSAKLKYDEQISKVMLLKGNFESVDSRLRGLRKCEREYEELIEKKLEIIKTSENTYTAVKLEELEAQLDKALRAQKEIEEAEAVGRSLLGTIDSAREVLNSAKNWGIWDIAGGDFFTSMAKHDKLNQAEDYFISISNLLQRFNKELGDVGDLYMDNVTISSATKTFDIFFDNIFTDFAVQNKINDALSDTSHLSRRVEGIMKNLGQEKDRLKATIINKRKEYDEFIETL